MIALLDPIIDASNFYIADFKMLRGKTVVDMVGFILVMMHEKCRLCLFSKIFIKKFMICTLDLSIFQHFYNICKVSIKRIAWFEIPNGIPVKITDDD